MHIEFLVEEPSAEAALAILVPKMLPPRASFRIHPHRGKQDLLGKLPGRMRGYSHWLPVDWRLVVLTDEDREACRKLKEQLERAALDAKLDTKSRPGADGVFQVVNRLAIEELEAWFFGDVDAIVAAYPRVPVSLSKRTGYRDPDAITKHGGTWEALQAALKKANYYPTGMPKIEAATRISTHMDPERNRSRSFQVFRDALREIVGPAR